MKIICVWTTIGVVAAAAASRPAGAADGPSGTRRPAATNLPGRAFPQIEPDLRVTFRIPAPDARQVLLDVGGGDRLQMNREGEGVWAVTTAPLAPGFHYYSFVLDGVAFTDPGGDSFFGLGRMVNGIEVPSKIDEFYETKDVPHGEVRIRPYVTKSTRQQRKVLVYTPPDYDADPGGRYPVLYLLHGHGEDRRAWWRQGRVNVILDNLLAAGRARPMVVVMEDGGIATGPTGEVGEGAAPAGGDRLAAARAFERVVVDELIPMIDANYRTVAGPDDRAIAGTGLGGCQALHIGLGNPDLFAHVGGFGALLPTDVTDRVGRDPAGINGRADLIFLSAGAAEREGNREIRSVRESWGRSGVRHVYYESPGTGREWLTWRRSLHQFAPRLFRKK
jgi:enterochelin esterase family protein